MNVTCPSCGAGMDLDVLLAHDESSQAFARLTAACLPLAKPVLQYVRLFQPAKRKMGHGRTVTLLEELLPDLQRGQVQRNGRDWPAPHEAWRTAIERMLELRDAGKLTLPLKSHGYLYEIIASLAEKIEAQAERDTEAQRRVRTGLAEAEPVAAALALPAPPPPPYVGPSLHAKRVKAEIEKRKRLSAAADAAETTLNEGAPT